MLFSFSKFIFLTFLTAFVGLSFVSAASVSFPVELTVTRQVGAEVKWAIPEGRVGASSTNWDTTFYLYFKDPGTENIAYKMDSLLTTTVAGERLSPIIIDTLPEGNFDVYIKTHQHLSKKLANISIPDGLNIFNFTTTDNADGVTGPVRLLAGDISGLGVDPNTLGDNEINSVDLSIMLNDLDANDLTTRGIRANVNQDVVVNSVDLSLLLKNLDMQGE
ncbi:MAG TPA: hypothetical protein P5230_03460 [Candidatus Magasanikbacteria bacterium]|nr:hypothetical protein [Candidatus Magasanikbacteria bacterium]